MDKIINVGVRITRDCTMRCKYCNINSIKRDNLSFEEWKKAFTIIKNFGVKDVVLLGGEPTKYEYIVELVNFLVNTLDFNVSITTNAFKNYDIVKELLAVGLTRLSFSVDNLDSAKSISILKNKCGLEMIDKLISENISFKNLTNYIVLNKQNIDNVCQLIEYMNSKNVSSYIIPFHSGNEGSFEHRKNDDIYAFKQEDYEKYCVVIDKIIDMKKQGYLINNSIECLENTKSHILNLDWKCDGLSELRIDSDGKMLCCCDNVGNVNNNFTIFDLESDQKLEEFFKMRNDDAGKCCGCLWPSSYEAERLKVSNV